MFGLFGKKTLKVHDKIWLSDEAKYKACLNLKRSNPGVVFVAWFEETKRNLDNYFRAHNLVHADVYLANYLNSSHRQNQIIFVEHHPLRSEE